MKVQLNTSMGSITLALDQEKAPKTVENFASYVKKGHYNGTVFHRVINDFMIQGGGFDEEMNQKTTETPIKNEASNGLSNLKYTIAMARTMDPHSASAQFFINVKDNKFLDHTSESHQGWGYCVFGQVVDGQETVDKIKKVSTGRRHGHDDVPTEHIIINHAEIIEE
jgi:peptidyl-prolyl cis-trans isomerase B (cyclophilin B)